MKSTSKKPNSSFQIGFFIYIMAHWILSNLPWKSLVAIVALDVIVLFYPGDDALF